MGSIGGTALDVSMSALSGFDARLGAELRRWLTAEAGHGPDGFTLAWLVTARVRVVGRHHLRAPLREALAGIQRLHRGHDAYLDAFLDAVLARHHDRFDNETYLALPLLQLILADQRSELDPVRLSALLLADVLRYEELPESAAQLDAHIRAARTEHAARFVAETDPTLGTAIPTPPGTAAGEWLSLTALPVSTSHDEYLLIRALQAQELLFGTLTGMVVEATASARTGQLERAATLLRRIDHTFERVGTLFGLVATVRDTEFAEFGHYLAGADATRPEAHQFFELACAELRGCGAGEQLAELGSAILALESSNRQFAADTLRLAFGS